MAKDQACTAILATLLPKAELEAPKSPPQQLFSAAVTACGLNCTGHTSRAHAHWTPVPHLHSTASTTGMNRASCSSWPQGYNRGAATAVGAFQQNLVSQRPLENNAYDPLQPGLGSQGELH